MWLSLILLVFCLKCCSTVSFWNSVSINEDVVHGIYEDNPVVETFASEFSKELAFCEENTTDGLVDSGNNVDVKLINDWVELKLPKEFINVDNCSAEGTNFENVDEFNSEFDKFIVWLKTLSENSRLNKKELKSFKFCGVNVCINDEDDVGGEIDCCWPNELNVEQ